MPLNGTIADYFVVFWAGVLVSFTPCVYPVLPITASFIGGINTRGSRLMGFLISLLYVLGLAVTYCSLGVIAALTGKFFGQIQNHPLVFLFVGNVTLVFALVMLDIIPLPVFGARVQNKVRPKNLWTVLPLRDDLRLGDGFLYRSGSGDVDAVCRVKTEYSAWCQSAVCLFLRGGGLADSGGDL